MLLEPRDLMPLWVLARAGALALVLGLTGAVAGGALLAAHHADRVSLAEPKG